jgi:outer membrane protein assembly factor BamE (lipoprotein component of BamABCDE complex)
MDHPRHPTVARLLLGAGLLAAAAAAHAALGVTIESGDEARVAPGMQAAAVRLALGAPALDRSYPSEAGPTWTYRVADRSQTVFDIQFDATGTVLSATERADESGRGRGRR